MSPRRTTGPRRPTIADIAQRAGVSAGAVSYALNGRPGVSDATRARVLQVAAEAGWTPSTAARALTGVGSSTVGMVITRPASVLGMEPFFMSFVSGVEEVLSERGFALLLQVSPHPDRELETYRRWWSERRVDGVFVVDLRVDDPRVGVLTELGLPAVVVGDPEHAGPLPSVWSDDAHAVEEAITHLASLGHRRIARVAGLEDLVHTQVRSEAFRRAGERLGVEIVQVSTDYTVDGGTAATRDVLTRAEPPTAVVLDNDLMAVGAMHVAAELGLRVPEDLSVLAWDDSPLCRLTNPPLSAMSRDVAAYGSAAARVLLDAVAGAEPTAVRSSVPTLVGRGSVGPAPAR
ncbi:LacI family DNA-binding transcriptional regulator [Cellulomonas carbonis]|uniref:LacI family transcriptional regulator n=1 Tax=Cellulomonas carbonis T26 TaxID=947969 RepID=A0A0A0BTM4_9CELL|nr:LacI family DNA-binding transcriptional regulator [Cellulomonas carbonis]KGM11295.1 LacI family transcriptional regulator [Cellulomonas carbonis T26]GGC00953.1 LacI family transcriptional regulator [Cellulomonas carbonis]